LFDWPGRQQEAERFSSNPETLEVANLLTLGKLLTTHIRRDRVAEGHLVSMFECGHIAATLRRMEEIREQME
jgi:hypothetical protein